MSRSQGSAAMPLDLSRLRSGERPPLLRPRDIYAALPKPGWPHQYLRHEQGEVLEQWFTRRNERDLVIKQNTGGGKTADGLLIAVSTLNEGRGPVVYLCADTYLVEQVRAEASSLGIATTSNPREGRFRACEAVLVVTFQKLVNGRSVFGVSGDGKDVIPLGLVIVDDAHAALTTTEGQFKITLPSSHEAYKPLLDMFADDLKKQSPKVWGDLQDNDPNAVMRVPFWSWAEREAEVLELLRPHRNDAALLFNWPLVADTIRLCAATVTSRTFEIRPPCPNIGLITAFAKAQRRVYLTATLADDSVLVSDLDADPDSVAHPITPGSAADMGERMILAPIALNPHLSDEAVRELAWQFSIGDRNGDSVPDSRPENVIVLVPSDAVAREWAAFADETAHVGDLKDLVPRLKEGHLGLVVLVNKYDGVDLPGSACRVLVIDRVPRPIDASERREATALAGSETFAARQVQRLEQGMGRGVRDASDHCVVLLMGSNLALTLHDTRHRNLLSPATRAQVELSRELATQLEGEGIEGVREAMRACLDRDKDWTETSKNTLAGVQYDEAGNVRAAAIANRAAFDLAISGQYQQAAFEMQKAVDATIEPGEKGWIAEQQAAYTGLVDPTRAQEILTFAIKNNPHVLRPIEGVSVLRIKAAAVQGRCAAEFLAATYSNGNDLLLGVRALIDRITWDPDRTDEAEAAFESLGLHLGFGSDRPERLYGTGPDNLWAMGGNQYAVIELKTGSASETISKTDLDQLGGSVRWLAREYGDEAKAMPVMVHRNSVSDAKGSPVPGMRALTEEKLEQLKHAVRNLAGSITTESGKWGDEVVLTARLADLHLTGPALIQKFATPVRRERPRR